MEVFVNGRWLKLGPSEILTSAGMRAFGSQNIRGGDQSPPPRSFGSKCQRCGGDATCSTMSRFNTQMICETCETKEKKHPSYADAAKAELEQVKQGNYNFKGVGLPRDLA